MKFELNRLKAMAAAGITIEQAIAVFEAEHVNDKRRRPRQSIRTEPQTPSEFAERELYSRGKAILGKSAGGLISSLLRHHNYDITAARALIETAAAKQDPREYVVASMRTKADGKSVHQATDKLLAKLREINELPEGIPAVPAEGDLCDGTGKNIVRLLPPR